MLVMIVILSHIRHRCQPIFVLHRGRGDDDDGGDSDDDFGEVLMMLVMVVMLMVESQYI